MSKRHHDDKNEAVALFNAAARGGVLLLCEHASHHIPQRYGDLGLRPEWRDSHAAWDPGARPLAERLAVLLDSPMVAGGVSRLVYDLNRPPESPSAMPAKSEVVEVPGNASLTAGDRQERVDSIYAPFCDTVSAMLDQRPRAIVTVHSFTPVFNGAPRDTEIGILHDTDARLADVMLEHAPATRITRRNDPYGPQDGVTHSLQLHGIARGLPNVMIEVRNDLLSTDHDIDTIAADLMAMLRPALNAVEVSDA
ncbi:N-formylglutamate amidohydrolase [Sagittula sp. SSi028]|uniref:N-formylglutamate amidohydrolase n=1 Tax=Sagittula sp. SSi028 TaxID=3400636 RepID=UPI003AF8F6EC